MLSAESWILPITLYGRSDGWYHWPIELSKSNQDARPLNKDDASNSNMDENEENNRPYKNRSLSWTNRYRKLIPYEAARARAISIGLGSKKEWDDFQESGEARQHGAYMPSRPDLMYPDDWVSWDEFLGVMRPYNEARDLIRTLGIRNFEEYEFFIQNDKKRAEGLRIPAKPHIVYRDKGFLTYQDFFGGFD